MCSFERISIKLFSFEKMSIRLLYEKNSIEFLSLDEVSISFEEISIERVVLL